jgi:hypothetical protein
MGNSLWAGPAKPNVSAALGMNIFLSYRHRPTELKQIANAAWDAGVRILREPLPWARVEALPGHQDWSRFDLAFDIWKSQGFDVMGLLGAPPAWARVTDPREPKTDHSMPKLDLWHKYVKEVVTRYKSVVRSWEVGNEPNFPYFWRPKPNPAEYAAFLKETVQAVKEADPAALTVAMSTSGCDVKFIEAVFQEGGDKFTEVVSIHPYSDAKGPELGHQDDGIKKTAELCEKYHLEPHLWITEMGWGTYAQDPKNGVSLEAQADLLVRGYALALSSPGLEKVFWYCFRDEVEPSPKDFPKDWEYTRYYGLVDQHFNPKPAYGAMKTFSEELAGLSFESGLDVGPDTYVILFGNGQKTVAVCWAAKGSKQVSLPLRSPHAVVHSVLDKKAHPCFPSRGTPGRVAGIRRRPVPAASPRGR